MLEADIETIMSPELANCEQGRAESLRDSIQTPFRHKEGEILVVLQVVLVLESTKVAV